MTSNKTNEEKSDEKQPKVVDEKRDQAIDTTDQGVDNDSEKKRKTSSQDRTDLKDTDHVQYHLDVDPNDPRNRPATPKLPSLDNESQK